MAEFPSFVTIRFVGYSEEFDPSVERVEMERGVAKMTLVNTQVMQELQATLQFKSAAEAASFEEWYFGIIRRIGWFNMIHPRTKQPIVARFKGGNIGRLVPLMTQFKFSVRDVTLEYLR